VGLAGADLVTRGVWHRVEMVLKANTPGVANGVWQLWFDGVQTHNYSNIQFSGPADANQWMHLFLQPVWGGTQGVVAQAQDIFFDHLYISGRP
jgi:hypothetical protein